MVTKLIVKSLIIIAAVLVSAAYFLWIYNDVGFAFTVKCLFTWGFCLASYTISAWLIIMVLNDFEVV